MTSAFLDEAQTLVKLAAEYWKLLRSYERVVTTLPPDNKLLSVGRNAERRLTSLMHEASLTLASYEGQPYSPNLAATAINLDEFSAEDELIVVQMLEPTILQNGIVLNSGKMLLEKTERKED